MKCIRCNKETPDNEAYCRHCGIKLDLTFDEITTSLRHEIKGEREQETEQFFRWLMLIVIFLFMSGWAFNKLWEKPPTPIIIPGYAPSLEVPEKYHKLYQPVIFPPEPPQK